MHTQRRTWAALVGVASIAVAVVACGGARTGAVPAGQAQLAISLVDAPNPDVKEIWVTVDRVLAHSEQGGWLLISSPGVTVDLLQLQGQALALGFANLPAGTVTEIRLVVAPDGDNHVVTTDGATAPLKVPSGAESGIKIKGPWDVPECNRTAVTLDFDGKNSIWYHEAEQGAEWILRPVIRVKKSETTEIGCTPAETPDAGPEPIDAGFEPTDAGTATTPVPAPPPAPVGAGSSCTVGAECLSGTCTASTSTCAPGGGGMPCAVKADCYSGTCTSEG
ncbi:MAG TPA: DUF4382 domain-containing protein, partial [Methylomirabilota bacterium]|nr:DUF4382 domain-containing protein [Methylomirabilota bacterium]